MTWEGQWEETLTCGNRINQVGWAAWVNPRGRWRAGTPRSDFQDSLWKETRVHDLTALKSQDWGLELRIGVQQEVKGGSPLCSTKSSIPTPLGPTATMERLTPRNAKRRDIPGLERLRQRRPNTAHSGALPLEDTRWIPRQQLSYHGREENPKPKPNLNSAQMLPCPPSDLGCVPTQLSKESPVREAKAGTAWTPPGPVRTVRISTHVHVGTPPPTPV